MPAVSAASGFNPRQALEFAPPPPSPRPAPPAWRGANAAEQGNDHAQDLLGMMYESGQGVPQDYVLAQSVQAAIAYKTYCSAPVPIQDQVLAQHANLSHGIFEQLSKGRNRYPISAHKLTAWSAWSDSREALVHLSGNHHSPRCIKPVREPLLSSAFVSPRFLMIIFDSSTGCPSRSRH
jgi:hypothetical protein